MEAQPITLMLQNVQFKISEWSHSGMCIYITQSGLEIKIILVQSNT